MKRKRDQKRDCPGKGKTPAASARVKPLFPFLLIAATCLFYIPAWTGKPIWDDDAHMTKPELQSLGGLFRIWFEPGATQQYYPLVHGVFWLEHWLWGDNVLPHHLLSILLHAASAFLLVRILQRLRIPGAWLAGAIFALHPVQVESVAWISELKNTLSGVFFFGALLQYLHFDESRNRPRYLWALVLFLLGLLCKTVVAPLPGVLLVIFWWKRGRVSLRKDVAPLIPFVITGVVAGLFTAWVERRFIGAEGEAFNLGWIERCLTAGRAFWFYLFKLLWPDKLTFSYPRWLLDHTQWWQYLFPFAALLLFAVLFVRRSRHRGPLAVMLVFAGLLFPALGFINVYPFIYSFVADHFQYLASSAAVTMVAAAAVGGAQRLKLNQLVSQITAVALLLVLGCLTWRQCAIYSDAETLYRQTLKRNPACWMALTNLGILLSDQHRYNDGVAICREVLQARPDYAEAYLASGNILLNLQLPAQAIAEFEHALSLRFNPDEIGRAKTLYFLGNAHLQQHEMDTAIARYRQALTYHTEYAADAHNNLGNALLAQGELNQALGEYEKVVQLRTGRGRRARAAAEYNLANALIEGKRLDEGIAHFKTVLKLEPAYAEAHNNLARVLVLKNQMPEALAHYREAVRLSPNSTLFQNNLAWQLATTPNAELRDGALAVRLAESAAQASNQDPAILNTLAAAYAENGQFEQAGKVADRVLQFAKAEGDQGLIEVVSQELNLFRMNLPYHRAAK